MVFSLALASILDVISRWDTAWFYMINLGTQNRFFDVIMPLLSDIKLWRIPLLVVSLAAIILGNRRVRATVLLAALALILSDQISSQLLKPLVARQRPSYVLEGVRLLMGRGGRYGFPSSHAANVFAVWTLLAVRHRRVAFYLLAIPPGVAYSRIYVGVHYPLDVLGGALLGILLALGVWMIGERVFWPLMSKRWKTPSRGDRQRKDVL